MDEIGGDYKNRPDQVMLFAQETPKALDFLLELGNSGVQAWKNLLARAIVHTSSVMVRRKHVLSVGGFDENLFVGEDQDFWIRLARVGELIWVAEPLVRVYSRIEGHMRMNADREIDCLLPMIERRVAQYRDELSAAEYRRILGRRYAQIGQNLCNSGAWRSGARLILRAVALGFSPWQHLLFVAHTSPPVRWLLRWAPTPRRVRV